MKDIKNTTACDPCERTFERNINHIVKEGKAPTTKAREKREHEVKAAFRGTEKPKK